LDLVWGSLWQPLLIFLQGSINFEQCFQQILGFDELVTRLYVTRSPVRAVVMFTFNLSFYSTPALRKGEKRVFAMMFMV